MNPRRPDPSAVPGSVRFPLAERALPLRPRLQAPAGPTRASATPASTQRRHPQNWPLYLFLFLIPLQNLQTGYLPNIGAGLNFLNVMFLLAWVGAWFSGARLARNEPVNRWVLAYALYGVVSLFVASAHVADAGDHFQMLKDQLIGLFVLYLVQMSVGDWSTARRVLLVTLLPLPYIARVIWSQHNSVSRWHYSDDLRISGTFSMLGANEFAAFCVTVAVVLFAVLIAARMPNRWRIALAAGVACMVLGVLYAYSRTAYIALLLGLVTVILAWRGRWKLMLPLLLGAALLPGALPQSVMERFDSTSVDEGERDESTEMRFVYWELAWDNFKRNPVVGTGFHTFTHPEYNPYGMDTHNLYLRTLSEGGLIGFTLLLGVLLSVFTTARRELTRSPTGSLRYALALGLIGAWMALVCGNLSGDRFTHYPMIAFFWVYVAMVVKGRHLPPEAPPR
ncbi:O-antigen ligase family protein [Marilutibacter alkalisoli]|uniref:O-antigen ligase family protein n=1 Tax=Marilutibacter alkalisoli TaxID=2591633 RepID=A0A514BQT2_9GAMM|nr:O-antigen ligase family protein [Lysobacter alkalisoli]QDH69754.1 O-antigen ligase family protein [Lysobacter alkalisoli]